MLRKLFFLVSLVFLVSIVSNALAFDPVRHKIDDFESWSDSDSMTWDKTIINGAYAEEANYAYWSYSIDANIVVDLGTLAVLDPPQNKAMEITYRIFGPTSTHPRGGVVMDSDHKHNNYRKNPWIWTTQPKSTIPDAGIRMWVKARQNLTNGTSVPIDDTAHKIYFGFAQEIANGVFTKWMSPRISLSTLDPEGQYVFFRLADFTCYENCAKPPASLDQIAFYHFGPYCENTTGDGTIEYKIWVDDIEFLPFDPDNPPDSYVYKAKKPRPYNMSACMSLNTTLNWSPVDGAGSYNVYFGTTSPGTLVAKNQTATTFNPGPFAADETYYWRIDVNYSGGTNTGDSWNFTTCQKNDVTFFFASDLHLNQPWNATNINSQEMIERMNALPGTAYPNTPGGTVARPRGLLLAGDLTNYYGVPGQWYEFTNDYGVVNGEGRIDFPVYEGYGNHDFDTLSDPPTISPESPLTDVVIDGIRSRNEQRAEEVNVSSNGLHYSWDWDSVHFVSLNLYPGFNNPYSKGSLAFLEKDLANNVGVSGRPVVIFFHYDLGALRSRRTAAAFYYAIHDYNVIGIFHGHTHTGRRHYLWPASTLYKQFDVYEHGPATFDPKATKKFLRYLVVDIDSGNNTMTVVPRYTTTDTLIDNWETSSYIWSKAISFGNTTGDTVPPTPDPMIWAVKPYVTSGTSISMTATIATDAEGDGVQYYFEETTGNPGGTDSGWQNSETYEDTGLVANTIYSYRVKTRDLSSNVNETGYSPERAKIAGY